MSASAAMTTNGSAPKNSRTLRTPPAVPSSSLLVAVGELDAERGAVAEVVADRVREPVQVGDTSSNPSRASSARMCSMIGRLATGTSGFGIS